MKNGKTHLIGIAGAGMSALAVLLKEAGYKVSGSDSASYSPIPEYLQKNKIYFFKNYNAKNIPKDAKFIVIGKHAELVPETNGEVRAALKSGITIKSLPEAVAMLSAHKENIVVAGSYGKSTCTALLSWVLIQAKKDPSYFVGAVPINLAQSSHLGRGKDFIIEGDEYPSANWDDRSKFLHFNSNSVLLTSGEHDHKNVFKTEKSYVKTYRKLVAKIPAGGLLVYSLDAKNNKKIIRNAKCSIVSYSLSNRKADWHSSNLRYSVDTTFDLINKGKKIASIKTLLLGKHNIENIVGCAAILLENKRIEPKDFAKAVASFEGIKRRIELLSKKSSVFVYEGFGSSYAKAKSVFNALKLHFPKKNLITIFEPHTFSWRNIASKKWYKDIFDTSSEVIILPPPEHGSKSHDQMSFEQIVKEVRKNHKKVYGAKNEKEALALIKKFTKKDSIIALISSGSLLGLTSSVPKLMEKMFPRRKL